jgi:hypothetical protein
MSNLSCHLAILALRQTSILNSALLPSPARATSSIDSRRSPIGSLPLSTRRSALSRCPLRIQLRPRKPT